MKNHRVFALFRKSFNKQNRQGLKCTVLMQVSWHGPWPFRKRHSFTSTQTPSTRRKPEEQIHFLDPNVLMHFPLHPPLSISHSFTSRKKLNVYVWYFFFLLFIFDSSFQKYNIFLFKPDHKVGFKQFCGFVDFLRISECYSQMTAKND